MHPKAKLQNAPTFTGNGSHSHVSTNDTRMGFIVLTVQYILYILLHTQTLFQWHVVHTMQKQKSADTNVRIGRYRLTTKRKVPIIGASLINIQHLFLQRAIFRHYHHHHHFFRNTVDAIQLW